MNNKEFAQRVEAVRSKLFRTAMLYMGSESLALDAVDEAVCKALCGYWRLPGELKDVGSYGFSEATPWPPASAKR